MVLSGMALEVITDGHDGADSAAYFGRRRQSEAVFWMLAGLMQVHAGLGNPL